jgi:hypothetical protein
MRLFVAIHNHCFLVRAGSDTSTNPHCQSIRVGHWRYSTVGVRLWRCQTGDRFQSYQVGDIRRNEEINSDIKEIFYEAY